MLCHFLAYNQQYATKFAIISWYTVHAFFNKKKGKFDGLEDVDVNFDASEQLVNFRPKNTYCKKVWKWEEEYTKKSNSR